MVYIDDFNASFSGMIMCHMIADTAEELLQMVDKIGVKRKWIQDAGTYNEHFDICLSKKKLAIKHGAIEISMMQLGRILVKRPGHPLYDEKTELCNHEWEYLDAGNQICNKCGLTNIVSSIKEYHNATLFD